MDLDVIIHIATSNKNPSGVEYWASKIDYGTCSQAYTGICITSCNNQTILQAVIHTISAVPTYGYSPVVFILGSNYIVNNLNKLSKGVPLHRLQDKPLRNLELWKVVQCSNIEHIQWRSTGADTTPSVREVVRLVTSVTRGNNGN